LLTVLLLALSGTAPAQQPAGNAAPSQPAKPPAKSDSAKPDKKAPAQAPEPDKHAPTQPPKTSAKAGKDAEKAHPKAMAAVKAATPKPVPHEIDVDQDPVILWSEPVPMQAGQTLSGRELNASANVAGTFMYSPGPGTVMQLGLWALHVRFMPNDLKHYNGRSATVWVTVQ
jgi:outer membrane biosynthesis protein TonB